MSERNIPVARVEFILAFVVLFSLFSFASVSTFPVATAQLTRPCIDIAYASPSEKDILYEGEHVARIKIWPTQGSLATNKQWPCGPRYSAYPSDAYFFIQVSSMGRWKASTDGLPQQVKTGEGEPSYIPLMLLKKGNVSLLVSASAEETTCFRFEPGDSKKTLTCLSLLGAEFRLEFRESASNPSGKDLPRASTFTYRLYFIDWNRGSALLAMVPSSQSIVLEGMAVPQLDSTK